MITLYNFGRAYMIGLPDFSPFVMKAEILLKMSGLDYELNSKGFTKAPKGKMPYIRDGEKIIADSLFIRFYLEETYNINFDSNISGEQKAILWAAERMCEEHLYHGSLFDRWMNKRNFNAGPAKLFSKIPSLIRPFVANSVKNKMKKNLIAHGMGRHSESEIHRICCADIGVLASILGDKPYFGGEQACGADATFGAFITGLLCKTFETPLRTEAESHVNLVQYSERMMARYYPDWDKKRG